MKVKLKFTFACPLNKLYAASKAAKNEHPLACESAHDVYQVDDKPRKRFFQYLPVASMQARADKFVHPINALGYEIRPAQQLCVA
ncbi:MAG: hypothetical protein ACE5H7_08965 [Acidiferrobacterales bacterium]